MFITENSLLLVLLCFMFFVGLMVIVKACCQGCPLRRQSDGSTDSVVQVSVIGSTVSSTSSIPDAVQYERNYCRMNDAYIDIDFTPPPSYEEAVQMPLPFKSIS